MSEELCEEVPAPSSDFYPRLSYVRRDNESQTKKGEQWSEHTILGNYLRQAVQSKYLICEVEWNVLLGTLPESRERLCHN